MTLQTTDSAGKDSRRGDSVEGLVRSVIRSITPPGHSDDWYEHFASVALSHIDSADFSAAVKGTSGSARIAITKGLTRAALEMPMLVAIREEYRRRIHQREPHFRGPHVLDAEIEMAVCLFYTGRPILPRLPEGDSPDDRYHRAKIIDDLVKDCRESIPFPGVEDYWEAIEVFGQDFTKDVLFGQHQLTYLAGGEIQSWSHFRNTLREQIRRYHVKLMRRLPTRRALRLSERSDSLLRQMGYATLGDEENLIYFLPEALGQQDAAQIQADSASVRAAVADKLPGNVDGVAEVILADLTIRTSKPPSNPRRLPQIYSDDALRGILAHLPTLMPAFRRSDLTDVFRPLVDAWYARYHGESGTPGSDRETDSAGDGGVSLREEVRTGELQWMPEASKVAERFVAEVRQMRHATEVLHQLRLILDEHGITRSAAYIGRTREALHKRRDKLLPLIAVVLDELPEEAHPAFGISLQRIIDRDVEERLAELFAEGLDADAKAAYVLYFLSVGAAREWVQSIDVGRLANLLDADASLIVDYAAGGESFDVTSEMIARGTTVEKVRDEIASRLSQLSRERGLGDCPAVLGRAFTLFVERLLYGVEEEL